MNPHAMKQASGGTQASGGVSNIAYDLLSMLHNTLEALATIETYTRDAQAAGDKEAEAFFTQWQQTATEQAGQLRDLLAQRLGA